MSTNRWTGSAVAVSQIDTLTPANVANTNVFTATINGKAISYTATGADTVATVCNQIATLISASTAPEWKEVTASNQTTYVQLLANTAGKPFTVTASATGGSATFTDATTTACTGPNFFTDVNNWSTGAVPITGDDVYFDSGNVPLLYGLSQSGITLNSLNVLQAYTGTIGLPVRNPGGYWEYRTTELTLSATSFEVGYGPGNGSGRVKVNVGSNACTMNVWNTGQPLESGIPSLIWRGTSGSNVANLNKGNIGLGFFPGNSATIATLNIGFINNQQGDVIAITGQNTCTITTINKNGGQLDINGGAAGITTITNFAGQLTIWQAVGVTTLNCYGGDTVVNTTGTIATINYYGNPILDFSQDQRTKTVTNPINVYSNAPQIMDPFKVLTGGGGFVLSLNGTTDLSKLDIGEKLTLTRS